MFETRLAKQCCSYKIVLFSIFYLYRCSDNKGPENITAPIGAIVTFHCLAQGDDAFWEINDTTIEYPEDRDPFTEKGFTFSEDINFGTSTYNFTITVNAVPGNNNTRLTCLVYPLDDNNFPGSLTVIGGLFDRFVFLLHLFNS